MWATEDSPILRPNTKGSGITVNYSVHCFSVIHVLTNVGAALGRLCNQYTRENAKTLTSYVAAHLIFGNAQRPGVMSNMTIEEFEKRQHVGDDVVISVLNHKTSTQGPIEAALD